MIPTDLLNQLSSTVQTDLGLRIGYKNVAGLVRSQHVRARRLHARVKACLSLGNMGGGMGRS